MTEHIMEKPTNIIEKKQKKKQKVEKPKKPKKVHLKKYICYCEGCTEEFPQWKSARDHMENVHGTKDPKLKRSIVYLDAKGEPKAAPKGAPKMVPYPIQKPKEPKEQKEQQCDTIKMRETPKVLATAPPSSDADRSTRSAEQRSEGHRGNDLGQFGPNWVCTWGASAQFPHLDKNFQSMETNIDATGRLPAYGSTQSFDQRLPLDRLSIQYGNQYGNNANNMMGNPQQSSLSPMAPPWEPLGNNWRMFRD